MMPVGPSIARFLLIAGLTSLLFACGGSGGEAMVNKPELAHGLSGSDHNQVPATVADVEAPAAPPAKPPGDGVMLSGKLTFDAVPFYQAPHGGLNYAANEVRPVRGVSVQLISDHDQVLATTLSDQLGFYRFDVEPDSTVRVRVLAQLVGQPPASWNIQVADNTQNGARYMMQGALAHIGQSDQVRNLHAPSGWTGSGYDGSRSAGPFAILEAVHSALDAVVAVDAALTLRPLTIYWSTNNTTVRGDYSQGQIGTSFYTTAGPAIYLLGHADSDSDEYDRAVVQHELAHFLEHELGRADSIGGSHSVTSRLDLRVAFAEGWGNAFAAIVSGDPVYRDSRGKLQAQGFSIDVRQTGYGRQGWFSEGAMQALLYQVADRREGLGLGFEALYRVMTDREYREFAGVASIYSFAETLQQLYPAHRNNITRLLRSEHIYGTGWLGDNEINNGGSDNALPVYTRMAPGDTVDLCSDNGTQEYNGLGVRRLVYFNAPQNGNYTFEATRNGAGLSATRPRLRLLRGNNVLLHSAPGKNNQAVIRKTLTAGHYVLEIYEDTNIDNISTTGGLACFSVAAY